MRTACAPRTRSVCAPCALRARRFTNIKPSKTLGTIWRSLAKYFAGLHLEEADSDDEDWFWVADLRKRRKIDNGSLSSWDAAEAGLDAVEAVLGLGAP